MRRTSPIHIADQTDKAFTEIDRQGAVNAAADAMTAIARQPGCLESSWRSIQPVLTSSRVRTASDELRKIGYRVAAGTFVLDDHLKWLSCHGYNREDSRQIRYVVETYYKMESVFATMSDLARRWLMGEVCTDPAMWTCDVPKESSSPFGMIEYADIQSCTNHGSSSEPDPLGQHPFMRALSIWPGYAELIWESVRDARGRAEYIEAVDTLNREIQRLSAAVAVPGGEEASLENTGELIQSIELCRATSCEAILLGCALRRMFIGAELKARRERMKAEEEIE